jgi:hypothetical protein
MTIKEALNLKKKLDIKLKEEAEKIHRHNTVEEHATKHYSSKESMGKYLQLTDEIVALKTSIYKASTEVLDIQFRLKKLKRLVRIIKDLNCAEGVWKDEIDYKDIRVYVSEITVTERDKLVEKYEGEVELLKLELENFYIKTSIN